MKKKIPTEVKHHWSLFNFVHIAYHASFSGCRQKTRPTWISYDSRQVQQRWTVCVVGVGAGGEKNIYIFSKSDIICSVVENAIGCLQQKKAVCVCVCVCVWPTQTLVSAKLFAGACAWSEQACYRPSPGSCSQTNTHNSVYIYVQNTQRTRSPGFFDSISLHMRLLFIV